MITEEVKNKSPSFMKDFKELIASHGIENVYIGEPDGLYSYCIGRTADGKTAVFKANVCEIPFPEEE